MGEWHVVHLGIVVNEPIELLAAKGKAGYGLPRVPGFSAVVDHAQLHQLHNGVRHQLAVGSQVISVLQSITHRVGHPPQSQLDAGPIGDLLDDMLGNSLNGLVHGDSWIFRQRAVCPHHRICLADMDQVVLSKNIGSVGVDLQDNPLGTALDIGMQCHTGGSKAHVAFLVRKGYLQKGDVRRRCLQAPAVHLTEMDAGEIGPACLITFPLLGSHEIGVHREVRVVQQWKLPWQHGAANLKVL